MSYEVTESIYKISQNHDTHDVIFFVYGQAEWSQTAKYILSHEELHETLLTLIHWYQERTRGEK